MSHSSPTDEKNEEGQNWFNIVTTYCPPDELMAFYQRDPAAFCEDVLGQTNYDKQLEILYTVLENQKTTIKSAPSVGKTYVMAQLILWFLVTHYPCKVLTTAPTMRQVRDLLWATIRKLYNEADKRGAHLGFNLLQTAMHSSGDPEWFAEGFSTTKEAKEGDVAAKITGYHAPNLLVVVDDAHGVDEYVISTIHEMLITGPNCKMVMIGNATCTSGTFLESHREPGWAKRTITAYDCINVREKRNVIPGLVTIEWVEEREEKWGPDHPLFESLVLAQFPKDSTEALIPISWVETANRRWEENADKQPDPKEDTIVSCDPGRSERGDPTAIVWRRANRVLQVFRKRGMSLMETTGILVNEREKGCILAVEVDGIGTGIIDRLNELEVDVRVVNVGSATKELDKTDSVGFINTRALLWWRARESLNPDGDILAELPPDDYLLADLTAPQWSRTSTGKIQIEKKESIKKRLGRSPDTGDAYCIGFAVYGQDEIEEFGKKLSDKAAQRKRPGIILPGGGLGTIQRPKKIIFPKDEEDTEDEEGSDDGEVADYGR